MTEGAGAHEVNGSPVLLLYGSTPCYRNLLEGEHGTDVSQLNTDLVRLGYGTGAELLGTRTISARRLRGLSNGCRSISTWPQAASCYLKSLLTWPHSTKKANYGATHLCPDKQFRMSSWPQ